MPSRILKKMFCIAWAGLIHGSSKGASLLRSWFPSAFVRSSTGEFRIPCCQVKNHPCGKECFHRRWPVNPCRQEHRTLLFHKHTQHDLYFMWGTSASPVRKIWAYLLYPQLLWDYCIHFPQKFFPFCLLPASAVFYICKVKLFFHSFHPSPIIPLFPLVFIHCLLEGKVARRYKRRAGWGVKHRKTDRGSDLLVLMQLA